MAKEFGNGNKKLQPMIFSHGLANQRMNQSGICRELASYGMFVVVINHNDESCEFTLGQEEEITEEDGTKKRERKPLPFNTEFDIGTLKYRKAQLDIRESELMELLD